MGVHDFTNTFTPTKREQTLKDLKHEDYAVDAYTELFRGTTMQYAAKLTNPAGEPTLHLKMALSNAVKRLTGGSHDIWCWDSRDPRAKDDTKNATIENRKETRRENHEEIKRLEEDVVKLEALGKKVSRETLLQIDPTYDHTLRDTRDKIEVLRARNPNEQHFSNMIRDVMFINEKLGIQQAIAPAGCDAEKLAAQLCREGLVDGVITVDTDSTVYGATKQIKKIAGKSGMYDVYELADILKRYDITDQQLAEVATALGWDDMAKTPRVGAKTVVAKVRSGRIEFTPEQIAAQAKFMDRRPVAYRYIDAKMTKKSLAELEEWLVTVQGFARDGVEKTLRPMYALLEREEGKTRDV